MKKFVSFIALVAVSLSLFAQEDCVEVPTTLRGTASVRLTRYAHKILPGVFTVGKDNVGKDKHVIFAQGNLQYQASTNTWRFAEEQYEKLSTNGYTHNGVRYASGNETAEANRETQSAWIDLFGWGTSGWAESGAELYQPWSCVGGDNNQSLKYLAGGNEVDLTGANSDSDWAYHNVIINGGVDNSGTSAHIWRVLTSDEWNYIFNVRTYAATKFGFGKLMGISGVFLLPDTWDWTPFDGTEFAESNWTPGTDVNYASANVITDGDVWTRMEEAGVVFLPTTAYRKGESLSAFAYGYYWSSTVNSRFSAYFLQFNCATKSTLSPTTANQKYRGHAIRPVYHLD